MRKHHLKVLGLSTLAVLAVMAVSASAAQAKWLIGVGKASVSKAKLQGTVEAWILSTEGMPLQVRCNGGTVAAAIETVNEGKELTGTGTAKFTGCTINESKSCNVNSPGEPAGSIVASGEGEAFMEGTKTFFEVSSLEFTTIVISGALCPFNEFEQELGGAVSLTLVNAETKQTVHAAEFQGGLAFASLGVAIPSPATEEGPVIKGSMKEAAGEAWAIQLTGL